MPSDHAELNEIGEALRQGKTATPVTIRTFLSWFDVQRRTKWNAQYINDQLAAEGIKTLPNYLNVWVDTPITFELVSDGLGEDNDDPVYSVDEENVLLSDDIDEALRNKSPSDPSFRIGNLASANNPPVSVKPNDSLAKAITEMVAGNFSQIPVMSNEREVKGILKWSSIGIKLAANKGGTDVQAYMEEPHEITASSSLFAGLRIILEHDYVLVRASDRKISGIVTSSDIAFQFEEFSTPFMLLAEIENHLRHLISSKLSVNDIKKACGEEYLPQDFTEVSELTFGNYVRIVDNEDNWKKLGVPLDRSVFVRQISLVNDIRNDVMHFDPDPLTAKELIQLRNVAKIFEFLKTMQI